ncbi:hypothetical protein Sme01_04230 [Sphaerisporangium melleum]|uniref:Uncharacterized protein n=1 Tax=Sphaerisporangium melleum TaxID=321316 RepID=A0A917VBQ8_9ACTN|nr:hypothetical protein [Sphaerisporangium melleum]GGK62269.1 hypothetical protein GCM10007964_01780 [Sphaerisporangium melleum]GII67947.1 hypothetical protein Sme01_04230 [Sphaerisporangium melleum]
MAASTPEERRVIASIAANTRWSREGNRVGATAKARNNSPASIEYWKKKVDPESTMLPAIRLKAAMNAKKAHYDRIALRMRQAKAAKRQATAEEAGAA